jgi:phosphate transport system substrate-binding protein
MKDTKRIAGVILAGLLGLTLASCGEDSAQTTPADPGRLAIKGAGATFPQPLYERWIEAFRQERPDLGFSYEGVGSGEGVKRFLAGSVDFGASDAAMSDADLAKVDPARGAVMIPMTAGMVVLAYNIPGIDVGLRLERDVYLDILAGKIRKWNAPRIQESNPGLLLPNLDIVTVARRDSSGTTYAMTSHLAAASPWWTEEGPGIGKLIDWPGNAMTAIGNDGVAQRVKMTDGAIGYMEYGFASRLGLPVASLENRSGQFVEPSPESGQAALDRPDAGPSDLRVFNPDPEGAGAYPIASYSWILLYARYPDPAVAQALKDALGWGLTQGQPTAAELGYIPLPDSMIARAQTLLAEVR